MCSSDLSALLNRILQTDDLLPTHTNETTAIPTYIKNGDTLLIEKQLQEQMSLPQINGLTLLGGEPMQNCEGLIPIIERLHTYLESNNLKKDIWLYSGYTYEQILADSQRLELLKLVDVLVDGLFIENLKDPSLAFRGSKNQRIIDVQNSLKQNQIVEHIL